MLAGDTIIGTDESEEINHYGVLGMKWGVHRARKTLNNPSKAFVDKSFAAKSLQTHRAKSQAKLNKLRKQESRLAARDYKNSQKGDARAARLHTKAAKLRRKSTGMFVSDEKAWRLERKANKLDVKSAKLQARSTRVKARLAKNRKTQEIFKQGINEIDKTLTDKGHKYLSASASKPAPTEYGTMIRIDPRHVYKPKG